MASAAIRFGQKRLLDVHSTGQECRDRGRHVDAPDTVGHLTGELASLVRMRFRPRTQCRSVRAYCSRRLSTSPTSKPLISAACSVVLIDTSSPSGNTTHSAGSRWAHVALVGERPS